jgi:hypothetical protein
MKPDIVINENKYYHLEDNFFINVYTSYRDKNFNFDLMEYGVGGLGTVDTIDFLVKKLTKANLEKAKKKALELIKEIKKENEEAHFIIKKFMFSKELKSVLSE